MNSILSIQQDLPSLRSLEKTLDSSVQEKSRSLGSSEFRKNSIKDELDTCETRMNYLTESIKGLESAALVLQEICQVTSEKNIEKMEFLVNSALAQIFFDKTLRFKIVSDIKRNQNSYAFTLESNGTVVGGLNSFGGAPWAITALILKIITVLATNKFPIICLDESLSFVSEDYIPATSSFIKDICKEFGVTVILVTHQPTFAVNADVHFRAKQSFGATNFYKIEDPN